jgi:TetR/AcrR family transcriptional regulator
MAEQLTDRSRSTQSGEPRRRDADASREAILEAAQAAFARDGYDGASMGRIAKDAGVSSALPAYFFGGKDGLYEAVIVRQFEIREATLGPVVRTVRRRVADAGAPLDEPTLRRALTDIVGGYVGFLADHSEFVRLMAWEALNEGRRTGPARPPHSTAVQDALDAILDALGGRRPPAERRQLLVTTVGLCFFPDAHADTMLAGLGIDAGERRWRAARVRHVVDVLVAALLRP